MKVTLTGYGEVDNTLLESLEAGQKVLVLDLFCQRQQTVDEMDRAPFPGGSPTLFDHHESTFDRYGNRPWAVVDTSRLRQRPSITGGSLNSPSRAPSGPRGAHDEHRRDGQRPRPLARGKARQPPVAGLVTLSGPWGPSCASAPTPTPP
ncbi:MAG: hypothetical protein M0C28_00115 [Candidatus Moduliflexus flocculans]|nr:hypothetical protein [Candidatus Moduliflexus flocculans]